MFYLSNRNEALVAFGVQGFPGGIDELGKITVQEHLRKYGESYY